MAEEGICKTAINTPLGLFEFKVMQFGLRGAAQTFQRYIDHILRGLPFVTVYIYDILVSSSSPQEHLEHLNIVFERLRENGLLINLFKCVFGLPEVKILGYLVSAQGISPLPEKVADIKKFSQPQTISQLRRFLGMMNFYRRSVPRAAQVQEPLNQLLTSSKKNDKTPVQWKQKLSKRSKSVKTNWLKLPY